MAYNKFDTQSIDVPSIDTLSIDAQSVSSFYSDTQSSICYDSSNENLISPTPYYQPILTSKIRSRTNISFFTDEELNYYFPNHKISIYIATWNMGSKHPPSDLNPLVLPDSVKYLSDVLVFGLQEAPHGNFFEDWEIDLQKTLGPSHVLYYSTSHGALHLAFFVRRFLIWYCSIPEQDTHNTSSPCAVPLFKTKGCIAVSFNIFGTSCLFINSHFPAHETQNQRRIEEYENVVTNMNLPKNMSKLKARYLSCDVTCRFDLAFWLGDLNFRVDLPYDDVDKFLYDNKLKNSYTKKQGMDYLLDHDQLYLSKKNFNIFRGFEEPTIDFPPTYKFTINSDYYDLHDKRASSFTDRILYKSKRLGHIINYQYNYVPEIQTSDHRPIFGLFEAKLRNCSKDDVPHNAGQFNRQVYIEGMKKRVGEVEDDDDTHNDCILS